MTETEGDQSLPSGHEQHGFDCLFDSRSTDSFSDHLGIPARAILAAIHDSRATMPVFQPSNQVSRSST